MNRNDYQCIVVEFKLIAIPTPGNETQILTIVTQRDLALFQKKKKNTSQNEKLTIQTFVIY